MWGFLKSRRNRHATFASKTGRRYTAVAGYGAREEKIDSELPRLYRKATQFFLSGFHNNLNKMDTLSCIRLSRIKLHSVVEKIMTYRCAVTCEQSSALLKQ